MEGKYTKLITALFKIARQDPHYAQMGEEYRLLESRFSEMIMKLSQESQDLAWEFVTHSEAMNWRMLEIICENMQIWRADLP